mgnify:CR=1 FL=1
MKHALQPFHPIRVVAVAFTPKGGCPLKLPDPDGDNESGSIKVAFTPKGGCPLKRTDPLHRFGGSVVAFTPKGGCPLKLSNCRTQTRLSILVAFTPKGGCPLKLSQL